MAIAHLENIAKRGWQGVDDCADQLKQLPFRGYRFGVQGWIPKVCVEFLCTRAGLAVGILSAVMDDAVDPTTGRWTSTVFAHMHQNPDPALLEDVFRDLVIGGDAPR